MKGQAVFAWIFGLVVIFAVITIYSVFIPVIQDVSDEVHNSSVSLPSAPSVHEVIDNVRIAVPVALLVLVVGIILYMVAAMQREEDHSDIIT